jgi:hypothetical protein
MCAFHVKLVHTVSVMINTVVVSQTVIYTVQLDTHSILMILFFWLYSVPLVLITELIYSR